MNNKLDFILIYDKEKQLFKIDFYKLTTDKYEKTKNLLLYYINIPKGYDLIYQEIGINQEIWHQDRMIIFREIEQLIYNLNFYFNTNITLLNVEIDEINKTINISVQIEDKKVKINVGKPDVIEHYSAAQ